MRYCSSQGIAPDQVCEAVVQAYFVHREATSFLETGPGRVRELMRAWNRCVERARGWPARCLQPPDVTPVSPGPAWEAFSGGTAGRH